MLREIAWYHTWNTLPAGSGHGFEIQIVRDFNGVPEDPDNPGSVFPIAVANITSYAEVGTGVTRFTRPEAESWVTFEEIELASGTHWFEATIQGIENNFWMTTQEVGGNESWINYDDLKGLVPTREQFGLPREPSWRLLGAIWCDADLDRTGAVEFTDLVRMLGVWGQCDHHTCEEDLDADGFVGIADLLRLLADWGPCPG